MEPTDVQATEQQKITTMRVYITENCNARGAGRIGIKRGLPSFDRTPSRAKTGFYHLMKRCLEQKQRSIV